MSTRRAIPAPSSELALPSNEDAEKAVLACVLLDNGAFDAVADRLAVDDFLRDAHRRIWAAFVRLRGAVPAVPVDYTTLSSELAGRNELEAVGGVTYLSTLTEGVPRSANVEHYARIVREKSQRRALVYSANGIMQECLDPAGPPVEEILDRAGEAIDLIGRSRESGALIPTSEIWTREWNDLDAFITPPAHQRGIPTGFHAFDDMTSGGLHRGQLIIVGGRPGCGKTVYATDVARFIGQHRTVAIFNQEMKARELFERMVCAEALISLSHLRAGVLDRASMGRVADAVPRVNALQIHLDESPSIGVHEIRARCRRLLREHGPLGLVVVDYLQLLIPPEAENRNNEIAKMSRGLKGLARELDCPVMVLSQLSREGAKRANPRPQLSDLRDSGAVEADADLVLFPWRQEYWLRQQGQEVPADLLGVAEFIIAKQRNGPCGSANVAFLDRSVTFRDTAN